MGKVRGSYSSKTSLSDRPFIIRKMAIAKIKKFQNAKIFIL